MDQQLAQIPRVKKFLSLKRKPSGKVRSVWKLIHDETVPYSMLQFFFSRYHEDVFDSIVNSIDSMEQQASAALKQGSSGSMFAVFKKDKHVRASDFFNTVEVLLQTVFHQLEQIKNGWRITELLALVTRMNFSAHSKDFRTVGLRALLNIIDMLRLGQDETIVESSAENMFRRLLVRVVNPTQRDVEMSLSLPTAGYTFALEPDQHNDATKTCDATTRVAMIRADAWTTILNKISGREPMVVELPGNPQELAVQCNYWLNFVFETLDADEHDAAQEHKDTSRQLAADYRQCEFLKISWACLCLQRSIKPVANFAEPQHLNSFINVICRALGYGAAELDATISVGVLRTCEFLILDILRGRQDESANTRYQDLLSLICHFYNLHFGPVVVSAAVRILENLIRHPTISQDWVDLLKAGVLQVWAHHRAVSPLHLGYSERQLESVQGRRARLVFELWLSSPNVVESTSWHTLHSHATQIFTMPAQCRVWQTIMLSWTRHVCAALYGEKSAGSAGESNSRGAEGKSTAGATGNPPHDRMVVPPTSCSDIYVQCQEFKRSGSSGESSGTARTDRTATEVPNGSTAFFDRDQQREWFDSEAATACFDFDTILLGCNNFVLRTVNTEPKWDLQRIVSCWRFLFTVACAGGRHRIPRDRFGPSMYGMLSVGVASIAEAWIDSCTCGYKGGLSAKTAAPFLSDVLLAVGPALYSCCQQANLTDQSKSASFQIGRLASFRALCKILSVRSSERIPVSSLSQIYRAFYDVLTEGCTGPLIHAIIKESCHWISLDRDGAVLLYPAFLCAIQRCIMTPAQCAAVPPHAIRSIVSILLSLIGMSRRIASTPRCLDLVVASHRQASSSDLPDLAPPPTHLYLMVIRDQLKTILQGTQLEEVKICCINGIALVSHHYLVSGCAAHSSKEISDMVQSTVKLSNVFANNILSSALLLFSQQEYNSENVEFWLAVENYKLMTPASRRYDVASRIHEQFVAAEAEKEINLPSYIKATIQQVPSEVGPEFYDHAQAEIFKLISRDSVPRFRTHVHSSLTSFMRKTLDFLFELAVFSPDTPELCLAALQGLTSLVPRLGTQSALAPEHFLRSIAKVISTSVRNVSLSVTHDIAVQDSVYLLLYSASHPTACHALENQSLNAAVFAALSAALMMGPSVEPESTKVSPEHPSPSSDEQANKLLQFAGSLRLQRLPGQNMAELVLGQAAAEHAIGCLHAHYKMSPFRDIASLYDPACHAEPLDEGAWHFGYNSRIYSVSENAVSPGASAEAARVRVTIRSSCGKYTWEFGPYFMPEWPETTAVASLLEIPAQEVHYRDFKRIHESDRNQQLLHYASSCDRWDPVFSAQFQSFMQQNSMDILTVDATLGKVYRAQVENDERTLQEGRAIRVPSACAHTLELSPGFSANHSRQLLSQLGFLDAKLLGEVVVLEPSKRLNTHIRSLDRISPRKRYRVAVVYVGPDHNSQHDIIHATDASDLFDDLLSELGWTVGLQSHAEANLFTGGLNIEIQTNMLYYGDGQREVVFHVPSWMALQEGDSQQVERKRHIGNDSVHIIWCENPHGYNIESFLSDVTEVFILLTPKMSPGNPVREPRVSEVAVQIYCSRSQILPFGPLVDGCVVERSAVALLARETAINAAEALRQSHPESLAHPSSMRLYRIHEIVEKIGEVVSSRNLLEITQQRQQRYMQQQQQQQEQQQQQQQQQQEEEEEE